MTHNDAMGQIKQGLEPGSQEMYDQFSVEHAIQASIAISLKRIADAMTKDNEYGEHGSQAIYGAIKRGLQNGRG